MGLVDDVGWFSFFVLFGDPGAVIFQLPGFYCGHLRFGVARVLVMFGVLKAVCKRPTLQRCMVLCRPGRQLVGGCSKPGTNLGRCPYLYPRFWVCSTRSTKANNRKYIPAGNHGSLPAAGNDACYRSQPAVAEA